MEAFCIFQLTDIRQSHIVFKELVETKTELKESEY